MFFQSTRLSGTLGIFLILLAVSVSAQGLFLHSLNVSPRAAFEVVQEFQLASPSKATVTVRVVRISNPASLVKRTDISNNGTINNSTTGNYTKVDLTPARCSSRICYAGSFQGPKKEDCDSIIYAQKYNSTGSLTAFPGTFVIVFSGTCAVVFQNPDHSSEYALDYNWATLGPIAEGIEKKCFQNDENSIGGACIFEDYLNFKFKNVLISLQRYDSDAKTGTQKSLV